MSLSHLVNRALGKAGVQLVRNETLAKLQAPHPAVVAPKPVEQPAPGKDLPVVEEAKPRPGVYNIDHIIDEMLPVMMVGPGRARQLISSRLGVSPSEIVALETSRWTLDVDIENIFHDQLGKRLIEEYRRFQRLLSNFDPSSMGHAYAELLTKKYVDTYFCQSITRVYHLVAILRGFGVRSGSILEVGSLFCNFAGPLQRLGYEVTAIDRYRQFGGALSNFVDDFRSSGGTVIETEEANEVEDLRKLGKFDAVIAMAVVEHIPHTPREFLSSLVSHVRPGGVLAIDTPNIARYWNRRNLSEGKSIHQDIEYQFPTPIPFEGHHREYTVGEVRWMLKQIGCEDIRTEIFDYNLFQAPVMTRNHIDVLMKIAVDDSLCDTILAAGRLS